MQSWVICQQDVVSSMKLSCFNVIQQRGGGVFSASSEASRTNQSAGTERESVISPFTQRQRSPFSLMHSSSHSS